METILGLMLLVVGFAIYFLPIIIASNRNSPAGCSIAVINIFFGWTLLGWVIALVWALAPIDTTKNYR